jgi:3-oxoacyl-[acyl-carrier-protein] synthase II
MLTPFYLIGFAGLQAVAIDNGDDPSLACRPFDKKRKGFALADGAGAMVLETLESARERGATVLAEVIGFGVSQDAFDLNRPCDDGAGAELCMRRALADAELAFEQIDAVNAHATATYSAISRRRQHCESSFQTDGNRSRCQDRRARSGMRWPRPACWKRSSLPTHVRQAVVPPTVNLRQVDEGCELDHVIGEPRDVDARTVLSVSFGMGGQNAAVILSRGLNE